jgi:hypothetical protein
MLVTLTLWSVMTEWEMSAVWLQLSVQLPWGISTGSLMNSSPWVFASRKMRIVSPTYVILAPSCITSWVLVGWMYKFCLLSIWLIYLCIFLLSVVLLNVPVLLLYLHKIQKCNPCFTKNTKALSKGGRATGTVAPEPPQTNIKSAYFIETFASLKSWKVSL